MGTKKLRQSELMMRAAESGENAVSRAHEGKMNRQERRRAREDASDQRDKDRAQRGTTAALNRQSRRDERREQGRQFDAKTRSSRDEFNERQEQRASQHRDRMDVDLAKSGLERRDPQGRSQAAAAQAPTREQDPNTAGTDRDVAQGDPSDPRMQEMQAEMQRGRQQMDQPVESVGRGRFVPTREAKAATATAEDRAEFTAETKRMQETRLRAKLGQDWEIAELKAQGAKTAALRKEDTAAAKVLRTERMKPVKEFSDRLDRFVEGKPTMNDFASLRAELGKDEGQFQGDLQMISDAIDAREMDNPRLQQWMQEGVTQMGVTFIIDGVGDLPDVDTMDLTSPGWQRFNRKLESYVKQDQMAGGGAAAELAGVQKSRLLRMRYYNKLAAAAFMRGDPDPNPALAGGDEQQQGGGQQEQPQVPVDVVQRPQLPQIQPPFAPNGG